MKCPACGKESSGKFCPSCGTPLQGGHCRECGALLPPAARFCTQCGTRAAADAGRGRGRAGQGGNDNLAWYVAAGVLAVLIVLLGAALLLDRAGRTAASAGGASAPSAAEGGPGAGGTAGAPLSGTPREQADRLFNRIMGARESGDTAQARFFLPMGLQAYRGIGNLDADGLFHLSMLETFSGEYDAALATANRILENQPDHLLGLASAAEAAAASGDQAAARRYWQRFLDAWDRERGRSLQEYLDHARLLPEYEAAARGATGK